MTIDAVDDTSVQPQHPLPPPHELHEVPPLDRRVFDSWEEFHQFMETYARRTFQLFRKRTSTSVKLRNRRMGERAKARQKQTATENEATDCVSLIPEQYGNYSVTLVCTHSGSYVSRGTGRRSRQDVRATRCNVQVNACLKLVDARCNRYQVTVTRALLAHNHRVDEETYRQYSNTRVNLPDSLINCVELMRKTGMKPRDVRAYIMENSNCAPTLKDVKNMLQRLRNQEEAALATQQSQLDGLQSNDQNIGIGQMSPYTLQNKVIREYRSTATVTASDETCNTVDPTTQFKVSHAMGNAMATLLAEVPASEFANAFRVMELAERIVRQRLVTASRAMTTSEEDQSESMAGLDTELSASDSLNYFIEKKAGDPHNQLSANLLQRYALGRTARLRQRSRRQQGPRKSAVEIKREPDASSADPDRPRRQADQYRRHEEQLLAAFAVARVLQCQKLPTQTFNQFAAALRRAGENYAIPEPYYVVAFINGIDSAQTKHLLKESKPPDLNAAAKEAILLQHSDGASPPSFEQPKRPSATGRRNEHHWDELPRKRPRRELRRGPTRDLDVCREPGHFARDCPDRWDD